MAVVAITVAPTPPLGILQPEGEAVGRGRQAVLSSLES